MFGSEMGAAEASAIDIPAAAAVSRHRAQTLLATAGLAVVLVLTSAAGATVLLWWVVHFHSEDRQLWMVPVGLVLFGTPIVAWFSVFASDIVGRLEGRMGASAVVGNRALLPVAVKHSASSDIHTDTAPPVLAGADVKRG